MPALHLCWAPQLHTTGQDYWRTLPEGTCHCGDTLTDPAPLWPLPLGALSKHSWKKALLHGPISIWTPENFPPCSLSLFTPTRLSSSILYAFLHSTSPVFDLIPIICPFARRTCVQSFVTLHTNTTKYNPYSLQTFVFITLCQRKLLIFPLIVERILTESEWQILLSEWK